MKASGMTFGEENWGFSRFLFFVVVSPDAFYRRWGPDPHFFHGIKTGVLWCCSESKTKEISVFRFVFYPVLGKGHGSMGVKKALPRTNDGFGGIWETILW